MLGFFGCAVRLCPHAREMRWRAFPAAAVRTAAHSTPKKPQHQRRTSWAVNRLFCWSVLCCALVLSRSGDALARIPGCGCADSRAQHTQKTPTSAADVLGGE